MRSRLTFNVLLLHWNNCRVEQPSADTGDDAVMDESVVYDKMERPCSRRSMVRRGSGEEEEEEEELIESGHRRTRMDK